MAYTQPEFAPGGKPAGTRVVVRDATGDTPRVAFRSGRRDVNVGWSAGGRLTVARVGDNRIIVNANPGGPRQRTIRMRLGAVDSFRTGPRGTTYALDTVPRIA